MLLESTTQPTTMKFKCNEGDLLSASEQSEAFVIGGKSCDSSISSVSLSDLDASARSHNSSSSSSESSNAYFEEYEDNEEDLKDIRMQFAGKNNTVHKTPNPDLLLSTEQVANPRQTRRTRMSKHERLESNTSGGAESTSSGAESNAGESNTGASNAESNTAVTSCLLRSGPRNRRGGKRGSSSVTRSLSQHTSSTRSPSNVTTRTSLMVEGIPAAPKRPSMSELVLQDMISLGLTDNEIEESLGPDFCSGHLKEEMQSPSAREKRKLKIDFDLDDGHEEEDGNYSCDSNDSNCWSESLRADLKAAKQSQHSTKPTLSVSPPSSTVKKWPNLQRGNMTPEQKLLGSSDHGTIHFFDSDEDSDSTINSDSSVSSESSSSESEYEESSVTLTNHTTPSSLLLSPSMRSQHKIQYFPETMLHLEEPATPPAMEETLVASILSKSGSMGPSSLSVSSPEVFAKKSQIRNKLQQVNAHMVKVFGQPSSAKLSGVTRSMLRAQLTGNGSNQNNDKKDASQMGKSYHHRASLLKNANANSKSTTSLQRSIRHGSKRSKSASNLLETKRSHADLSRQKLLEAFTGTAARLSLRSVVCND